MLTFVALLTTACTACACPLPQTAAQASRQAVSATLRALKAGRNRLQLSIFGDEIGVPGPLPLGSLCAHLVEALAGESRQRVHLFFDSDAAAAEWARSEHAARLRDCCCVGILLSDDAIDDALEEDGALLLCAPCNTAPCNTHISQAKLEAVQRLTYGAGERPVILANPDLEALLVRESGCRSVQPMLLSDFEHAFFMAEVLAKQGSVSAVRHVWGGAWETYHTAEQSLAPLQRGSSALQFSALTHTGGQPPRAAEDLVRYVRRGRRARSRGTPTVISENAPWSAEDRWS